MDPPYPCKVAFIIVDGHPLCAPMSIMSLTICGPMLEVTDVSEVFESVLRLANLLKIGPPAHHAGFRQRINWSHCHSARDVGR